MGVRFVLELTSPAWPGAPAMSRLPMAEAYIKAVRPRMSLRLMSVFVCLWHMKRVLRSGTLSVLSQ